MAKMCDIWQNVNIDCGIILSGAIYWMRQAE